MMVKYRYLFAALFILSITSGYVNASGDNCKSTNPFEMVIFNLGFGKFSHPKITHGKFKAAPSLKAKNKLYELGVEVPFYKEYVALGFQFDIISGHRMAGTDYNVLVKFRLPLHSIFGDIALTNTYRAGLIALLYHKNMHGDLEMFQFGGIFSPSIGIDYFPIRWLGVYCEYTWRMADMFLNRVEREHRRPGQKKKHVNSPYGFSTGGVTVGIKLTF